jgi:pimeloyl-ACP methyl ester carboxylesterase
MGVRPSESLQQAAGFQKRERDMPQMSVLGTEVFYREEGAGPAVVLGHSSTASSGQWRSLFAHLQNRYRVIAPDHVGYGRTPPYQGSAPLVEHELAIIDGLVHWLGEPAHLVGHSYGGALMARAAVRAPERVRSLTLIEPVVLSVGFHAKDRGTSRNLRPSPAGHSLCQRWRR